MGTEKGVITKEVFLLKFKGSTISRLWTISGTQPNSPWFSTPWEQFNSRISRISKFSRISRKWTFLKRPLFHPTAFRRTAFVNCRNTSTFQALHCTQRIQGACHVSVLALSLDNTPSGCPCYCSDEPNKQQRNTSNTQAIGKSLLAQGLQAIICSFCQCSHESLSLYNSKTFLWQHDPAYL